MIHGLSRLSFRLKVELHDGVFGVGCSGHDKRSRSLHDAWECTQRSGVLGRRHLAARPQCSNSRNSYEILSRRSAPDSHGRLDFSG